MYKPMMVGERNVDVRPSHVCSLSPPRVTSLCCIDEYGMCVVYKTVLNSSF